MSSDAHVVSTLRHVALPVISNSLCNYYMYGVHDKIICAGRTSGGIDTCQVTLDIFTTTDCGRVTSLNDRSCYLKPETSLFINNEMAIL